MRAATMNTLDMQTVYEADARATPEDALPELSMVRAVTDIREGETLIPKGAIGAIVLVYPEKNAYQVEFVTPFHAVVGAHRRELERT